MHAKCLHVDIKWLLCAGPLRGPLAGCRVVDSLRHSNAEYRGTSRIDHKSAFKISFNIYYVYLKFKQKYIHIEYTLLNGFKKVFTAEFHVPLSRFKMHIL